MDWWWFIKNVCFAVAISVPTTLATLWMMGLFN